MSFTTKHCYDNLIKQEQLAKKNIEKFREELMDETNRWSRKNIEESTIETQKYNTLYTETEYALQRHIINNSTSSFLEVLRREDFSTSSPIGDSKIWTDILNEIHEIHEKCGQLIKNRSN